MNLTELTLHTSLKRKSLKNETHHDFQKCIKQNPFPLILPTLFTTSPPQIYFKLTLNIKKNEQKKSLMKNNVNFQQTFALFFSSSTSS